METEVGPVKRVTTCINGQKGWDHNRMTCPENGPLYAWEFLPEPWYREEPYFKDFVPFQQAQREDVVTK